MARTSEKNWLFSAAAAFVLLSGCPIYEDGCDSRSDCASGFVCDLYSHRCSPAVLVPGCLRPDQCAAGETCAPDSTCRPGSCDYHGCVQGYVCGVVDSAHACVLEGDAAVNDAAPNDSGAAGSGPVDAAIEADASADSD